MEYFVYAVAALLVVSVGLFVKAALFSRRPQKTGLLFMLLAMPLYMVYYADRWPFGHLPMRDLVSSGLANRQGADFQFESDIAPAAVLSVLLLVHMTVFQRVAVRQRIQRVADPIANFFAGATCATLIGGTLVSTFHWGWQGAVIVASVFALVYLGALALLAAIVEIVVELSKLIATWVMRKVFAVATFITRIASFVSSLSGRLGLNALVERLRAENQAQEATFQEEQETQDRALYEAYLRDRARRRRLLQKRGKLSADAGAEPAFPGRASSTSDGAPTTAANATGPDVQFAVPSQPTESRPAEFS
ncbi:MAG: hypothetical protein ACM30G_13525 [Micromonosporaceae bacterium]